METRVRYAYFLIDVSLSMSSHEEHVVNGTNGVLDSLLALLPEGECLKVTCFTFNNAYDVLCKETLLTSSEPRINKEELEKRVEGQTALYDTIVDALTVYRPVDGTTVCIITDGEDTCSKRHDRYDAKEMIRSLKARGIHFIYVAIGAFATYEARELGIWPDESVCVEEHAQLSEQNVVDSLSQAISLSFLQKEDDQEEERPLKQSKKDEEEEVEASQYY
jgi:hypothetical protein